MNRENLKSIATGHISVQRLTALFETFTLKHVACMLPDLLKTADLRDSFCREYLLAVFETEVKGRSGVFLAVSLKNCRKSVGF